MINLADLPLALIVKIFLMKRHDWASNVLYEFLRVKFGSGSKLIVEVVEYE